MNSTGKELPDKIYSNLKPYISRKGVFCLVAFSGGPDSTALLTALSELSEILEIRIAAAYVNHGLRPQKELEKEDRFVQSLTDKLHIPLFVKNIPTGNIEKIALEERRSTEEVARDLRYDFFYSILKDYSESKLLLGHNLDDQFETMITRYFQGSSISGLKGIPSENGSILRPMLNCRKKEIYIYLSRIGQNWCHDKTNEENSYLRNRVRNSLIPLLEEIFPGMEKSLLIQEQRFRELDDYFEEETKKGDFTFEKTYASIDLSFYNQSSVFIRRKILYQMFDHVYCGERESYRLPARFLKAILYKEIQSHSVLLGAHGITVYTNANKIVMKSNRGIEEGFFLHLGTDTSYKIGKYYINIGKKHFSSISVVKDSPLIFRSSAEGDFIVQEKGKTYIKEILRQWRMDNGLSRSVAVLEDSLGIAAIFGEIEGFEDIYRNKKKDVSEKLDILYLEIGKE